MELTQIEADAPRTCTPHRRSLLRCLMRRTHWKCLLLTGLMGVCLGFVRWCQIETVTVVGVNMGDSIHQMVYSKLKCRDGYLYIPISFLVMFFVVYLVECYHCDTRVQLKRGVGMSALNQYMRQLHEAAPAVWWRATCYHYERQSRQVLRYRNGDPYPSSQIYYERVDAHAITEVYSFAHWGARDLSKRLVSLDRFAATKITFDKSYSFASAEARADYVVQRASFFRLHEFHDDFMETEEGYDLSGCDFKDSHIVFSDPERLPWYFRRLVFWFCTATLLAWPLRVLIEYQIAHANVTVLKVFGEGDDIHPAPDSRDTSWLSRTSSLTLGPLENFDRRPVRWQRRSFASFIQHRFRRNCLFRAVRNRSFSLKRNQNIPKHRCAVSEMSISRYLGSCSPEARPSGQQGTGDVPPSYSQAMDLYAAEFGNLPSTSTAAPQRHRPRMQRSVTDSLIHHYKTVTEVETLL